MRLVSRLALDALGSVAQNSALLRCRMHSFTARSTRVFSSGARGTEKNRVSGGP